MSPQSTKVIFHTTLRRSTHSSFLDIYSSECHPTSFQCYLHTTLRRSPHPPLLFFFHCYSSECHPILPKSFSTLLPGDQPILLSLTYTLQNVTPYHQCYLHTTLRRSPHPPLLFFFHCYSSECHPILPKSFSTLLPGDQPILLSLTYTLQNVTPYHQCYLHTTLRRSPHPPLLFFFHCYSSECHPILPKSFSTLLPGNQPILLSLTYTLQNVTPYHQCYLHTTLRRSPHPPPLFFLHCYSSECHPILPKSFSTLLPGDQPILLSLTSLLFRMSPHSTNVIFHTTLWRSPHAIISSLFPYPLLFRMSSHSPNAIFHTSPLPPFCPSWTSICQEIRATLVNCI